VVAVDAQRLVRVARAVQRREQEVTRTVTGEHTAGAVPSVRRGCETDDQQAGAWVAEAGHRPRPGVPGTKARDLLHRTALAPFDEPRARATLDHVLFDAPRGVHLDTSR